MLESALIQKTELSCNYLSTLHATQTQDERASLSQHFKFKGTYF